ncbi:MAG TPA: hypothetical protein VFM48_12020 [Aquabacterium sp.]|nr:hypothetical protein [Aquabacterium sp.]
MLFPRLRLLTALVSLVVLSTLAACANYHVYQSKSSEHAPGVHLQPQTVEVVWKTTRTHTYVSKQTRGVLTPEITNAERYAVIDVAPNSARALFADLIPQVNHRLSEVVIQRGHFYALEYYLQLELLDVTSDTDGSREATISMSLMPVAANKSIWHMVLVVYGAKGSPDKKLVQDAADAIQTELKNNGLVS